MDSLVEGTATRAMIPCHDPATGGSLGEVPVMDAGDVRGAVDRAREAQRAWARTSFSERRAVLRALLALIVLEQDRIAEVCVRDSGKTLVDAAMGEIFPVCEKIRWTIRRGARCLRPERRASGVLVNKRAEVHYEPLGVVGVIAPWNFPFHNLYCPLIPALFAGNGVVVKVSEWTSWSAAPLVRYIHRALFERGHSPELVQIVTGYGETGAALVRSGAEKIFFTGSPQNGRRVMEAASEGPVPVVLELGGKDPMI
ncbi:MAG: aldehyde dehydrogenase family protein, partial [Myxococcales bacterium]|nr:aldehyde dehydrogenase family protein [Myxococcales bacterium]